MGWRLLKRLFSDWEFVIVGVQWGMLHIVADTSGNVRVNQGHNL